MLIISMALSICKAVQIEILYVLFLENMVKRKTIIHLKEVNLSNKIMIKFW